MELCGAFGCVCTCCAHVAPTPKVVSEPEPEPISDGGGDVSGGEYGTTFHGDGTYYSGISEGNCGYFDDFPSIYSDMTPG